MSEKGKDIKDQVMNLMDELNRENEAGRTALQIANEHRENEAGRTALQIAYEQGSKEVEKHLREQKTNKKNKGRDSFGIG